MGSQSRPEFRWREADAYLFDIDGTLLLSPDRTHRYALHRALLDVYRVETTIDGIAYHGKTDPGILRAALERAGMATDVIDGGMAAALEVVRRLRRGLFGSLPDSRGVGPVAGFRQAAGSFIRQPGVDWLAQAEGGLAGGVFPVWLLRG